MGVGRAILTFGVAPLVLGWTAGTVLQWIARPAAGADLPTLTSRRALLEIVTGIAVAAWSGRALVTLAVAMLVLRIAMELAYRSSGGIRAASLLWVRVAAAVAVLLTGFLPESFR